MNNVAPAWVAPSMNHINAGIRNNVSLDSRAVTTILWLKCHVCHTNGMMISGTHITITITNARIQMYE